VQMTCSVAISLLTCTLRIFNAYPVANKRVDIPQKTTRAKRLLFFSVIKV